MPDKINFTNCIKITRKIIILIASFSLYYCAKSETDLVKPNIEFNNSVNNLILSQTSGSINISFNSALEWTASCDQSWCDISSSSGKAGNSTISVNVSDNTTYDDRNASIKISSGTISKIFTITQKQKDAIITGNSKIEVGGDAQTVDIEVKANVDYTIKIDEGSQSWISQNTSRGLSSQKLSFNIKGNESIDNREGHITISDGKLNEVVSIYQQGEKPSIVLTQKEYIVSSEGEVIKIEIKSNVDYEMILPQEEWVNENSSRAMSYYTHYINVKPNSNYDQRETNIIFKNKKNNIQESVKIIQKQKNAIIAGSSKFEIGGDAQTVDIEVKANVDYTIKIDEGSKSWISQNTSRGLSSKKISFNVKENESIDNREGHITISDGKLNEVVTIYQFGNKPTIILTQKEYIVPSEGEVIKIEIKSNVDYEMIVPQEEWVNENSSRAISSYTHYINVKPNPNYDQRETNIIFKNKKNNIQESVKIIQEQKDAIIATNNKYLVQSGSCNLDIDINANVEYSVNIDVSWIKQITSRNLSAKSVHFHLEENTGENERKGIIKLSHDNLSTEIIITQKGKLNSGGGIDDMPNNKW